MKNIKRLLKIDLPQHQSAFLWGARKTGKTTYLRQFYQASQVYNFLDTDLFFEVSKTPSLLRQRILALDPAWLRRPIILDEVQKVPAVMDEVHYLIEEKGLRFILCGSSARQLKRRHANLLGGRAWRFEMFPFTAGELADFDLLRALRHGLIPSHYLQDDPSMSLRAYVMDYLKEEVFSEGLVRNMPAFSRFFDAMGYSHGEMVNFANIARDCGVDAKTVREYYQILVDTLLGRFVEPFKRQQDRGVITRAAKFYLFDVGVAGAVMKRHIPEAKGEVFGRAFEHFIFMELAAYRGYAQKDYEINYWRTKSGQEVDFILAGGEVAVEVKGAARVDSADTRGIRAFMDQYKPRRAIIVCHERSRRIADGLSIMPWQEFLQELWAGKVV
ncbi:MAG: AAA family ATPase [Candidatus Omnitrophota bacterium]